MSARPTNEIVADLMADAQIPCDFADYDCQCATCRGLQHEAASKLIELEAEAADAYRALSKGFKDWVVANDEAMP